MQRIAHQERPDWQARAERNGFKFHTIEGERYWDERHYYAFTLDQVEKDLEAPTEELHHMCLDLVGRVVRDEQLLKRLGIPEAFFDPIAESWREGHPHLYGRFDLVYDGKRPAKMIEANYDTPTSIYEAAAFQWDWLEDGMARGLLPQGSDQFNSIEERLGQAFQALRLKHPFYFASIDGSEEDKGTCDYLRAVAEKAGLQTEHIYLQEIGLQEGRFVDLQDRWIPHLFKLQPWEFIFEEEFGAAVAKSDTQFIEPMWKAIISNKGMLPLLWEMHRGHPNLLECHVDTTRSAPVPPGWVRKPFFSREGSNIELHTATGEREVVDGPYGNSPQILQRCAPLPRFGHDYTLIGSWVIGDCAAGIGIREDSTLVTKDSSRFVPHLILG